MTANEALLSASQTRSAVREGPGAAADGCRWDSRSLVIADLLKPARVLVRAVRICSGEALPSGYPTDPDDARSAWPVWPAGPAGREGLWTRPVRTEGLDECASLRLTILSWQLIVPLRVAEGRMKQKQAGYRTVPDPKIRRWFAAAFQSVRHRPMIHGLIEVDVTSACARIREHR